MTGVVESRHDVEEPAPVRVEETGEHGRGVEFRQAEKRHAALQADQRKRLQITDDAVRLDRRIARLEIDRCAGLSGTLAHGLFSAAAPLPRTVYMPIRTRRNAFTGGST